MTRTLITIPFALALSLTACDDATPAPAPPHPDAVRLSLVVMVDGRNVRMIDSSTVSLPAEFPLCLLDTPGLVVTDAEAFPTSARLTALSGEPPDSLARLLDARLAEAGWRTVHTADSPTLTTRGYARSNWSLELTTRADRDATELTAQLESTGGVAP